MSNLLRSKPVGNPFPSSSLAADLEAIAGALRRFGRALAINQGEALHSQLIKHGLCTPVFIANNLMTMYSDFKLYDGAQKLFDEIPERNVVSWTACISAHTRAGNPREALRVFARMPDCELEGPNGYTFSAALKACAMAGDLEMGKRIHDRVRTGAWLRSDTVLVNAVIDMYVKCGSLEEACRVFDAGFPLNSASWNTMVSGYAQAGDMVVAEDLFCRALEPDAVSFNTLIAGFAQTGDPKALDYVCMMHKRGHKLDNFTFPSALKTCGGLGFDKMGEQIHGCIIKCGFSSDSFIGPSLIYMYSNCGHMNEARRSFDEYQLSRGSVSDRLPLYNSMVSALISNGYDKHALDLVFEIYTLGFELDAFTLSSALKVCSNLQNIRLGLQVHGLIITTGYQFDKVVGSILINLYAMCGKLEDSRRLFLWLPRKDLIAWTGLITGCVQQGSSKLAFSLFRDMICQEIEVDHFVVSSILKACASLPWLLGGEQVHALCIKGGFESEGFIATSLVDMYSKCGNIEDGIKIFRMIAHKDTVCWTGMILACAYNGKAAEATELFQNMVESGEKPNEITFLGVLSACRHGGLVADAYNIFNAMREKHGMLPSLEHYRVMVDVLSRDGRVEEAMQMVSGMPYEADETIRKSMLGASMIHQKHDFDKLSLATSDASGYVAMSNVYASLGRWESSAKLRQMMRRVGMKEPGRSWIEVGD